MSFNEVASQITKESIVNAVYIDDDILLPFESPEKYFDHSELYRSFKNNDCLIDFNRFSKEEQTNYKKILSNKDLLVLDWHLMQSVDDLSATFEILNTATQTSSLHFCVIYTRQEKEVLAEKVILNIASYYSGLNRSISEEAFNKFIEFLDATGLDQAEQEKILENLTQLGKELFLESKHNEKTKEIITKINQIINTIGGIKVFKPFLDTLNLPETNFLKQMICLGFLLGKFEVPEISNKKTINTSSDKLSIQINSLYIKVFSKDDIAENRLYDAFTSSLTSESNIFLTILGLESKRSSNPSLGF